MSRRRFYVPRECIRDGIAVPPSDQVHHLRDVLRLKVGDAVELFDGEGVGYMGTVKTCGAEVHIGSLERLDSPGEAGLPVVLAQALIKSDRFEWILQKATELGVHEIVPLATRHCDVRIAEGRIGIRLERWRRIVREASKQCRRLTVPVIQRPIAFADFLALEETACLARLLFCERASKSWDTAFTSRGGAVLGIGPEGGWHPAEIEAAQEAGFQVFNLGSRTLRAETAALAAVTLVQFQISGHGLRMDKDSQTDFR